MLILNEYAQGAPDDPVRVEVLEVTSRGSIAVKVEPILDADIGKGDGAWTADELLIKVSEILGEKVSFKVKEKSE